MEKNISINDSLIEELKKYRIDPTIDIQEPPTVIKIGGCNSMTTGNFSMIIGKAKSGKTFLTGAIVSAFINGITTLENIEATPIKGKSNVVYVDTEQSTYHATRTIKRICSYGFNNNPENLYAYALRPLSPKERLDSIEKLLQAIPEIGLVIIDGIRDLLQVGINDEGDATTLISHFLRWTADYDMHMIILLHQNKADTNARGHIGTEAVNKAETTFSVTKDTNQNNFLVSCEYSRDMAFDNFGFCINDGLIESSGIETKENIKKSNPMSVDKITHKLIVNKIFTTEDSLLKADFLEAIQYNYNVGVNNAKLFAYHLEKEKLICQFKEGRNVWYKKEFDVHDVLD